MFWPKLVSSLLSNCQVLTNYWVSKESFGHMLFDQKGKEAYQIEEIGGCEGNDLARKPNQPNCPENCCSVQSKQKRTFSLNSKWSISKKKNKLIVDSLVTSQIWSLNC